MKSFIAQASAVKNGQELLNMINRLDAYFNVRPDQVKHRVYARNYFPRLLIWQLWFLKFVIYNLFFNKT